LGFYTEPCRRPTERFEAAALPHSPKEISMKTLLVITTLLGLVAGPAFAQAMMTTTQSPPSPNSSQASPQSDGSVPRSAETSEYSLPGSQLEGYSTAPTLNPQPGMADPIVARH